MSLRSKAMYLDISSVLRNMGLLNHTILPARIRMGLTAAGSKFMIDTVIVPDTMPIRRGSSAQLGGYGGRWSGKGWTASERKAGELRASGALFVDGKKMRTTRHYGEFATGKYQPESYGGTPILPKNHEACVVFNAPYAAKQHESFPIKTEPTAGRYFMSSKLYGNAVEYIGIIAKAIRL